MKTTTKKPSRYSKKENNSEPKKDRFIEKILENLDKVNANDWKAYTNLNRVFPTNLFTKKRYSGFNVMALFLDAMINNFNTSRYATFKSISKAGGRLKKGSRGTVIEFFSYIFKNKETGKNIVEYEIKQMTKEDLKNVIKIPCLKNYVVFNSEFIDNLEEINLSILDDEPQENEFSEIENCEEFILKLNAKGLKIKFALSEVAFYTPTFDFIEMPKKELFISTSKYYATIFHEIIHWTGHSKRLDRNLRGHKEKESYSFEELIAEMGSMLCCLQFGILDEFVNSIRYLKGWSSKNLNDRETNIRTAFSESKKAKKYLEI